MTEPKDYGTLISPKSERSSLTEAPERRPTELYAVGGLPKGELVAARFEVLLLADSGAMADVYRARDGATGELVALKVLRSEAATLERFEREASALSLLTHPGVPRLVATGRLATGQPFLAMEWVEGVTLDRFLKRQLPGPRAALEITIAIADVLAAAHLAGVVHRDLNPTNVMVLPRPGPSGDDVISTRRDSPPSSAEHLIKLLDFGVAHHSGSDLGITREGTQIGTPGYMAPEQVEGARTLTPAADVFALGCVLYELLTGERPFDSPTLAGIFARILRDKPARLREFDAALPEELDRLMLRLLDKDPLRRPEDGAAALSALRELPRLPEIARGALTPASERAPERGIGTVVLVGASDEHRLAEIDAVAQRHGARAEQLQEGGVAVTILGNSVVDDAALAAAFALELRSQVRIAVIAMATGLVTAGGGATAGRALDAALVLLLLRSEVDESGSLILLAETTAHLLDASFEVRRRGAGFVLSSREPRREGFRSFHGTRAEFVGRSRELSVLTAAHAQSREDRAAVVLLVTGPAGIGKSRLGYEFALAARRAASGVLVLRSSAAPHYAGQRHALLVSLLERAAQVEPSDSRSTRRARLRERLSAALDEPRLSHVLGALERAFDLEPLGGVNSGSVPAARSERPTPVRKPQGPDFREPLLEWLRAELGRSSIVLVVDDLHLASAETVDLLDDLLRSLAGEPLFVLLLGRPEVAESASALFSHRGFTALKLSALSPRAALGAVQALGAGRLEPPVLDRIVERSRGVPLWLEHLVEAALEGQLQDTPERVLLLAQSELLRLEPDARRLLETVSVLGLHFWSGAARHLVGHGVLGRPLDVVKRQLLESGLVNVRSSSRFEGEEELEFASASLRDGAYALLGESSREELHGRAADWLTEQGESDPLPVAMHYTLGGQLDLARRHYLRAARQAMARFDDDAVIAACEEALSHGASRSEELLEVRLLFATALYNRGDPRAALPTLQPLLDRGERGSSLWCGAVKLQSQLARETCRPELAVELAQRLLEVPDRGSPALERALARVAADLAALGRPSLSHGLLDSLDRQRQRLHPDSRALAATLEARARLLFGEGRAEAAVALLGDAATAALEGSDERAAARLEREQATWYLELGDQALAREALARARERARRARLALEEPLHELLLLRARVGEGASDDASSRAIELAGAFDATKAPRARAEAHLIAAEVCVLGGQHEAAQDLAEEALHRFEPVPEAAAAAALWLLSLAEAGDARAAADVAKRHVGAQEIAHTGRGSAWLTLARARIELDSGDEAAARARALRALSMRAEEPPGTPLHPALEVAARWLRGEGELGFSDRATPAEGSHDLSLPTSSSPPARAAHSVTERAVARLAALGLELRPVVDQNEPTLPIYLAEFLSNSLRRLEQPGARSGLRLRPGPIGRWLGIEGPLSAAAGRAIESALRRLLERTAEQCLVEVAWIETWALDRRQGRATEATTALEHWDEARLAEDPSRAAEHVRAGNRALTAAIVRRMSSLRSWLGRDLSRDVRRRVMRNRERPLRRLVLAVYLRLGRQWRRAVGREWRTHASELLSLGEVLSLAPSDAAGRAQAFHRAERLRAGSGASSGDRSTESLRRGSGRSVPSGSAARPPRSGRD